MVENKAAVNRTIKPLGHCQSPFSGEIERLDQNEPSIASVSNPSVASGQEEEEEEERKELD